MSGNDGNPDALLIASTQPVMWDLVNAVRYLEEERETMQAQLDAMQAQLDAL